MAEVMSTEDMYRLLDNVAAEIAEREFAAGPGTEEADRMADANEWRNDFYELLTANEAYAESGESLSYGSRKPPKVNLPRLRRMLAHNGIQTAGTDVSNPVARA